MVISCRPLRRSGLRLAIQQHSPQPLLEQHPPLCTCDRPLAAPDREHRLSVARRPLSSNTASSARLEPVEGLLARTDSGTSVPHIQSWPKIALTPALACFCCLPAALQAGPVAVLISPPPIGSGRQVGGSLRGRFHEESHASPFQRTSVSRRSEQVDD